MKNFDKKKYNEVEIEVLLLTAQDVFLAFSDEKDVDDDPYDPTQDGWWS